MMKSGFLRTCSVSVAAAGMLFSAIAQATTASADPSTNQTVSYVLGNTVIYKQAFYRFNGTGTPWDKACETVIGEWQDQLAAQPWWNRDDAMSGCLDTQTHAQ